MRTLAIGDIHGCSRALNALLELVQPQADDTIVTLGDYVDRGPDTLGVLDRLLALRKQCRLIALRGNHEQMMLDARAAGHPDRDWLESGGDATLRSYAILGDAGKLVDVPDIHWDFLERTPLYHEIETHFFVHASVFPEVPLDEQPDVMMLWEKFDDPAPHVSGKIMVCGHTPQKNGLPRVLDHAVCIDTWAHGKTGWLSCLDVANGRLWQANQKMEKRELWLSDL